jgi:hypothetical protein
MRLSLVKNWKNVNRGPRGQWFNANYGYLVNLRDGDVVDGWAVSAAACHAGGPGSIPGPGQTYV